MKPITKTVIDDLPYMSKIKEEISKHTKEQLVALGITFFKELLNHTEIDEEAIQFLDDLEKYTAKSIPIVKARKMSFRIHEKAKISKTKLEEFTYRTLGHLIATIHVKTHNYVFLIYCLKSYYILDYPIHVLEKIAKNYHNLLINSSR